VKLRLVLVPLFLFFSQTAGHPGEFIRGEVNSDGQVNVADPVFIVMRLFLGGDPPSCEDAADANDDGVVDLSDAVYELAYLFAGGPPPPWPGPFWAGHDATPNDAFPCGDAPHEIPLSEDEIFDRLTRNAWIRVDPSGFTTFTSYAFQRFFLRGGSRRRVQALPRRLPRDPSLRWTRREGAWRKLTGR